ncbi:hypothetical protein SDC9_175051 [bioreactor metagenome]|uniref:Uncharacterized protein n=1 Tax=bioreactor metagenome TaxID=1076179 RepID=A0A645GL49_9ZZZZ
MRTIDVSIGHDDDLFVSQLLDVSRFTVFFGSDSNAQCGVYITYFFAFECLVVHGFLHIQNLTTKWKNGLEHTVTSLLGSSTRRVTLDKE